MSINRLLKRISATTIISLMVCGVYAQDSSPKIPLDFSEALKLTHSQNLILKAGKHEHRSAILEKKAAGGLRSPQIEFMANYTYLSSSIGFDLNPLKQPIGQIVGQLQLPPELQQTLKQMMGLDWNLTLQKNNFGIIGVGAIAPIYMGGKINAANNAAKINIKSSEEKTQQEKNELCTELSERYFGLSLAYQVKEVRYEVLKGMEKHHSDAIKLEENGIIAKGDKLYAEMFLSRAQSDYQKSSRDIISINSALSNTLNAKGNFIPMSRMFTLKEIEPLDFFINNAVEKNPKLRQVGLKQELAKEGVRAERASLLPTLSAMGAANIYDHQLSNLVPRAMVGVSLNYKLFNGLTNINKYKSAKEQVQRVAVLKEKAQLDIITLIEKSYNDILSLSEQITSYDATINFAQEYLRIKEKAFNEGVASSSDVVDAQLNLAKAKIERLQLAFNFDVSLAKLLENCGLSDKYIYYMVGANSIPVRY